MIDLEARLRELDGQGLRRRRRVLDSPQGAHVRVDGRPFLSFSSNDYLGQAASASAGWAARPR